jgi:ribonuclease HI
LIATHLTRDFNQSLRLGYCPAHFRESITVVLRKPGKDNYTAPKAYRPIALLNTIGKAMDAVIARRLSYLAETHHMLPATHVGGRKNRHTNIAVDGYLSKKYAISTGIPQGSPLSPILYLFYNADLIDECNQEPATMSTGYIDDVGILFQLTHFTRSFTRIDTSRPVQIEWGEVKPKATCKYLGLTMGTKLRWKEHVEEIRQRATKTVNALSCLGGSTWGVGLLDMRRIYEMMYACSIWYNASTRGGTYTQKTLEILQSIQARAARAICGAYRATSSAALDIEAHLLPIEQQIWKHNADVVTRLLSSKATAEMAGLQTNTTQSTNTTRKRRRHIDSWQKIYNDMESRRRQGFDTQEPVPPFMTPPWRRGPTTHIEQSAEKAPERHNDKNDTGRYLSIYTDGSGIDGETGAAAVCTLTQQTRAAYMGPNTVSTVYAAELQGISLALQIAQEYAEQGGRRRNIAIYTDNQAAIWSIAKAEGRSGAYILEEIASQVQRLQDMGRPVTVRWIPAHVGIPGNEAADTAAKEATGWRENGRRCPPAATPPKLYPLESTLRRWCKAQAERAWTAKWRTETKGRATYRHTPRPTKKVLQLHEGLSKRESALLVQLRTEKIGLKDFLFNRRVPGVTSPRCECGERRQTVAHILLSCRTYRNLRNQVFGNLSGRNNLRTILSKPQLATKAIQFIEQTQILGQVGIRDA